MTKQTALGSLLVVMQVLIFLGFVLLPWREPHALSLIPGLVLAAGGIAVVTITFKTLGNVLTATLVPRAGVALHTGGIFAAVRHPFYSGVLLTLFGLVVAVGSWWSLTWWLISLLFILAKSRWEDSLLAAQHPGEWHIWAQGTPALIPYHSSSRVH